MSVARIDLPPKRPQNTAVKDGNPHRKNHGAEASPPEITGIQWAGTLNRIVGPEESAVVFEIRVYRRGRREDSETGEGPGIPTQTQGANSPQSKVENIFTLMLGNKMYVNAEQQINCTLVSQLHMHAESLVRHRDKQCDQSAARITEVEHSENTA